MSQTASITIPIAQELPIACTLAEADRAARRDEIDGLFSGRQEVRELPDGYALRFAGEEAWAARLLGFIAAERTCCPFFTFALVFEPGQGPLWLHLRGPEGTKDVVADLLGALE